MRKLNAPFGVPQFYMPSIEHRWPYARIKPGHYQRQDYPSNFTSVPPEMHYQSSAAQDPSGPLGPMGLVPPLVNDDAWEFFLKNAPRSKNIEDRREKKDKKRED